MKLDYKHKVMVAGHRGDPDFFPENTMQSFVSAINKGVDMIETDVHMCLDGEIVIMHDELVDRTTDSNGSINEMTLSQIKKLNAGTQTNIQRVPTLIEFLDYAAPLDILFNIELKDYFKGDNSKFCIESLEKTLELLDKYNVVERTVINSFDAFLLQYISEKYNGKYMLHGYYPHSIMKNVDRNPDEYLYCACIFDIDNKDNFKHLKGCGIEPWLGANVKNKEQFKQGVANGARLFTTNDPAQAIKILESLGVR